MKFKIIAADPPWEYDDMKTGCSTALDYPTMTDAEIAAMGRHVRALSDRSTLLAMWITLPKLIEGAHLPIFKAWGFRVVGPLFSWIKTYKNMHAWPLPASAIVRGQGHATQGNMEICIRGMKGSNLTRHAKNVPGTIIAPLGRNSEKPNHIWRAELDRLYGMVPTLELFARSPHPGWVCIGNDLTGNDIHQDMRSLIMDKVPMNAYTMPDPDVDHRVPAIGSLNNPFGQEFIPDQPDEDEEYELELQEDIPELILTD